jgi:hypothetical protein
MPLYIDAYGFILLRVGGSVFCLVGLAFLCRRRLVIFHSGIAAAFLVWPLICLLFFKGLSGFSISAAVLWCPHHDCIDTFGHYHEERMQKKFLESSRTYRNCFNFIRQIYWQCYYVDREFSGFG